MRFQIFFRNFSSKLRGDLRTSELADRSETPHRHLLRELERDEEVPPQAQQPHRHHEARVAGGRSRRSLEGQDESELQLGRTEQRDQEVCETCDASQF